MDVLLPTDIAEKLVQALEGAGRREIGGILMGERLEPNGFRVADLTIQRHGGSFASFVRNVVYALAPLHRFFVRTGHDYQRFNYLGEWHSHPAFPAEPSLGDIQSMTEIVEDLSVGALFAVLLIVRLDANGGLDGTATVFVPGHEAFRATLVIQNST